MTRQRQLEQEWPHQLRSVLDLPARARVRVHVEEV